MAITQSTFLVLKFGTFKVNYHTFSDSECITLTFGDIINTIPIIRIHSSCLFGESFFSLHCDCSSQLEKTLELISKNGSGVVVYTYSEGRGIGLEMKIKAMEVQRSEQIDTVAAFASLGYKPDLRKYSNEIKALKELSINSTVDIVSNNPLKIEAVKKGKYKIRTIIKPKIKINKYNRQELITKKNKMGHYID